MIDSIKCARRVTRPWPHLEFFNFFPESLLASLKWPKDGWRELMHPDQLRDDGTYRRKQQLVTGDLGDALCGGELETAIRNKLGMRQTPMLYPMATYNEDAKGYWIGRHPDSKMKIITMQIYMSLGMPVTMGTRLSDGEQEPHREDRTRQVPFIYNSGYAFKVGPDTWHEVSPGDVPYTRRSIMLIYYDRPEPTIHYAERRKK